MENTKKNTKQQAHMNSEPKARKRPVRKSSKRKQVEYPSKGSQWAYWMQAIEPADPAINAAFPGFHPLWVQHSQRLLVSGEQFQFIRKYLLDITQKQCAAYLRVNIRTLQNWEQGIKPIPFMAFELLRLVYESAAFKLTHKGWDGWFISREGKLVCPDRGSLSFAPADLSYVPSAYHRMELAEAKIPHLNAEIAQLKGDIEALRAIIRRGTFVDEMQLIKDQLENMLSSIGETTAKIYDFPSLKAITKENAA